MITESDEALPDLKDGDGTVEVLRCPFCEEAYEDCQCEQLECEVSE